MYSAECADWTTDPQMVGHLTGVEKRMLDGALRVYRKALSSFRGAPLVWDDTVMRASEDDLAMVLVWLMTKDWGV